MKEKIKFVSKALSTLGVVSQGKTVYLLYFYCSSGLKI